MLEPIISTGVSFFAQESMQNLAKHMKGYADQKRLLKDIEVFLQRQFDSKFMSSELNIDYGGLIEYFKSPSAMAQAFSAVYCLDQKDKARARESFISRAISCTRASTSNEIQAVTLLMEAILTTIQSFYLEQCEPQNLVALSATIEIVSKLIHNEHNEIQRAFDNLIQLLPKLMEKPIELVSHQNCEWDKYTDIPRYVNRAQSDLLQEGSDSLGRLRLWDALQEYKHIVLLGEAGAGKSFTLRELFVESSRHGYKPIFLRLLLYPEISGLKQLFDLRGQISCDYILLLDGLDEIRNNDRTKFFQAMNDAQRKLHNIKIVITSRLNAYDYQNQQHIQLEGFEKFFLIPIAKFEYEQFAIDNKVDYKSFMREITEQSLHDLCINPFYFTELIKIWKADSKIPKRSDLLKEIINRRFKEDANRGFLRKLFENQNQIFDNMQKVALVMACMKVHEVNNNDFQHIIKKKGSWKKVARTGFVNLNGVEAWEFSHNIIREFFAAQRLNTLPKGEILHLVSASNGKLKPSWLNTFSLYCQICTDEQLLKKVISNDIDTILYLETISYSEKERTDLFVNLMEQHERAETMVDWYDESLKRLTRFAANDKTLSYLLGKLSGALSERHTLNLLRVLQQFPKLYNMRDNIKATLLTLACDEKKGIYIGKEAIRALRTLEIFEEQVCEKLVAQYEQCTEMYVLEALYYYIIDGGYGSEYIPLFLIGDEVYSKSDQRNLSARIILREGQKHANTIVDLGLIFQYYQQHPNRLRNDQDVDVYVSCCEKAAELYSNGDESIIQCFIDSLKEFWHRRMLIGAYKAFMEKTQTESNFFEKLLKIHDVTIRWLSFEVLMNNHIAMLLVEQYGQEIEEVVDVVDWYVNRLNGKEDWFKHFDDAVYKRVKKHIQLNVNFTYEEERKARMQKYFDALFSQSEYQKIVQDLINCIGNDVSLKKMHEHLSSYRYWKFADLHECANALLQTFGMDSDIYLSKCVAKLSWEKFAIINIQHLLSIANNDLAISTEQSEELQSICLREYGAIPLKTIAKYHDKGLTFNAYAATLLKLMEQQNIKCNQEMFLDMLMIPPELFIETARVNFPQYILNNIAADKLKERVFHNLERMELYGSIAVAHILCCLENSIEVGSRYAVRYILSDDLRNYDKWAVIRELYINYGVNFILEEILPYCNSLEILKLVVNVLKIDEFSPELDQKIINAYHEDEEGIWYEFLIKRSNREALERYYKDAKEKHRIPDLPEKGTNRIGEITIAIAEETNIDVLDIIEKLFLLSFDADFTDHSFFGLRSRMISVFTRMARDNNELIVERLEKIRFDHKENEELRLCIIDLLEVVRMPDEETQDKPMTLEEAIDFVEMADRR